MLFFKTRNKVSYDYLIYNDYLPQVEQLEDLGFRLMPSLSFRKHVEFITCKALCTLVFIRWNASDFYQVNCLITLLYLINTINLRIWVHHKVPLYSKKH